MSHPMTAPCECEHRDHFANPDGPPPEHPYGEEVDIEKVTQIRTIFGRFTVCVDCATTCMKDQELTPAEVKAEEKAWRW